jgi:hypothetical protein
LESQVEKFGNTEESFNKKRYFQIVGLVERISICL